MTKIKKDEFYNMHEVVNLVNEINHQSSRKQMLLRHIRMGKLKAKNVGGKKTQRRYVVQGKQLIDYINGHISGTDYTKK